MPVFWWIIGCFFILIAAVTIFDLIHEHQHHGWGLFGWIVAIIVFPFIGSIVYWVRRESSGDEVEQQRLAQESLRQEAAHRSVDTTSIRP